MLVFPEIPNLTVELVVWSAKKCFQKTNRHQFSLSGISEKKYPKTSPEIKTKICHPQKIDGLVWLDVSPSFHFWGEFFQVNGSVKDLCPIHFPYVLLFKTIYFWLVVRTWDLGSCMGLATQGMHWNHNLLQMMWHQGKQKKQLIQRVIISESKWHNGIMSYKPRFWWISMNVLMCVGFLVFFDSHSTSYLEMSYLYHVYILSHNVSRNKAKSKGMYRHTEGILYSQNLLF